MAGISGLQICHKIFKNNKGKTCLCLTFHQLPTSAAPRPAEASCLNHHYSGRRQFRHSAEDHLDEAKWTNQICTMVKLSPAARQKIGFSF
jgi:hypothetical protein